MWQLAAGIPPGGPPFAKSRRGRFRPGWLGGYRHEFASVADAERSLSEDTPHRDLILHLIAAHHGWARPGFPRPEQWDPEASPGANRIEASPRSQGYRSELELPPMRWAAFSLRTPDDRPLIVDGARGTQVAAMVRHAIHQSAKCSGLDAGLISELMGHGGDGRISVQPLPNVGYRHADGRIRRVLLVAPACVDGDAWRGVVSGLAGAALIAEASGEAVGMLTPLGLPDPMLGRYRGEGRCWTSATPVVLPGYDSLWGRLRPERSVRKLLRHVGVAEALLERAAFSRGSRLRGSAHPLSYRRPGHLSRYPCLHLSVEWTVPVRGPLALGAGVGYGLGLLVPVGEEFLCCSRGDVEGN